MTATFPSWNSIRTRLAGSREVDLTAMAEEARQAEAAVAELEEQVRRGRDIAPGQVEAAEARGRHIRLRLDGVAQQHDQVLAQAREGWALEVHSAAADLDDAFVFDAVQAATKALATLVKVVPEWNERFAVVLDAARQVPAELGIDVGDVHGALRIDGRTKHRVTLEQLVHQALYDAVDGVVTRLAGTEFPSKAAAAHNVRLTLKDRARTGI